MSKYMKVHIIGGGIVGLCSAWFLLQKGCEVVIVDKSDLSDGTSHGNAGMIVPSHFVPLAAPGVIAQGIKWMFDAKSPFFVRPRMDIELIQWLWRFYRSCNQAHVDKSMPTLYSFNEWSKQLYQEFHQLPSMDFAFEKKGLLMLYQTKHQEEDELQLADKAHALGVKAEICSSDRLKELEPNIRISALGGIFFPGDAHLYPQLFMNALKKSLLGGGARFLTGAEVIGLQKDRQSITGLHLKNGSTEKVNTLLVAGGSWSTALLKSVGVKILLQDGKGYSITLQNPMLRPTIPSILSEAKVAVTPMGGDLRIGGTLELSNLSSKIHPNRLAGIIESMPKYYPDIHVDTPQLDTVWHGFRPCSPDGLPYIDRLPNYTNTYVATGHGMMGMSLGPATGKMISELMTDEKLTLSNQLFKMR